MRHVHVQGTTLSIEDEGIGPAIIFLHAGVADARMWDSQFSWLRQSYRVIRWDFRGYGSTPHVPGPFSYAHDVRRVMDVLEIQEATLVGCSMGGATAIRVALETPDRVSRLALAGTALHGYQPPQTDLPPIVQEMMEAEEAEDWNRMLDLDLRFWIVGMGRDESTVDPGFLTLCRDMLRGTYQSLNGAEPQDALTSDVERVSNLAMPLLLVVGMEDTEFIHEVAKVIADGAPNAQVQSIADTAHLPSLERYDRFNEILAEWLIATER